MTGECFLFFSFPSLQRAFAIQKLTRPRGRPDTSTCLLHPYFWDSSKRLNFLQEASDRFEIMCRDPRDPLLVELERGAAEVVGNDWNARLDKWFIENLGKYRKYDRKSVQDLMRALRNKVGVVFFGSWMMWVADEYDCECELF